MRSRESRMMYLEQSSNKKKGTLFMPSMQSINLQTGRSGSTELRKTCCSCS